MPDYEVERPSGRKAYDLRPISIEKNIIKHAYSSCLVSFGDTKVLCTASLSNDVPRFLRGQNKGWVTAEYGMLPASTHSRIRREATEGRQGGRTMEIQRLIGRSLRSVINLADLGERQITIDCDVLQADGGTRTASITGGYVALHLACNRLIDERQLDISPIQQGVAAVSCGLYHGVPILDLDYDEDSNAGADANFVLTHQGDIVEIQGTAEEEPFSTDDFLSMLQMAKDAVSTIAKLQEEAICS